MVVRISSGACSLGCYSSKSVRPTLTSEYQPGNELVGDVCWQSAVPFFDALVRDVSSQ
jgi:hypothetical protein